MVDLIVDLPSYRLINTAQRKFSFSIKLWEKLVEKMCARNA